MLYSLIRERERERGSRDISRYVTSNLCKLHFCENIFHKAILMVSGVIFITLLTLGMGGCAFENLVPKPIEETNNSEVCSSTTPYASLEELESLTNESSEIFYWRASRAFALIALEDFKTLNGGTMLNYLKDLLLYMGLMVSFNYLIYKK